MNDWTSCSDDVKVSRGRGMYSMLRPEVVYFRKGFKDKPVKKHSTSSSSSIKDINLANEDPL
jgi:hypothetical protein